jgi:ectoine hydroxylase-related dioxygenase (phytanoyl-CoA dioxygenase family)
MRKSYPQTDNRPRPSTVAWHTDGGPDVGYFSALILWVPFTPCNDEFTGLELRSLEGTVSRPNLDTGDALLFGDTLAHRTADCPTSTQNRYSCDMRFFRAADIPARVHQKVAQEPLLSVRAFASHPW